MHDALSPDEPDACNRHQCPKYWTSVFCPSTKTWIFRLATGEVGCS